MKITTVDGNTACAMMAYKLNEIATIYPITPSSTMAELCDQWASEGQKNIFDEKMIVREMQSEGGAAGALHGCLETGSLTTTFTASQGLLLMIPNMYKIAGEALPCVIHVSARALATHALSIFGDHSDVMACKGTGFNMICSTNVQECYDMALATQILALKTSLPILHFFDGFRTSHEISKISLIDDEEIKSIYPFTHLQAFKNRALTPINPVQRGTAQNPDVFFQNRERINPLYKDVYTNALDTFKDIEKISGRKYSPYEYYGDAKANNVVVVMGSAFGTLKQTIDYLNKKGAHLGVVNVRLYRPFFAQEFCNVLPKTVKKIAVLDRTKDNGSIGEPLYEDVISAIFENKRNINIVGGRYGLGSKEFTTNEATSVFDNLNKLNPKNHFTVGIVDDVSFTSLPDCSCHYDTDNYELKFFGLGSDGTVSANKNSIKIIGEETENYVQAYFEYDSKKSGSLTTSHLTISKTPIIKEYNSSYADFIAIHNFSFISRYDFLSSLTKNGTVLLNSNLQDKELQNFLPATFIKRLKEQKAKLYVIDAQKIAQETGLGGKINVIMQTAFFKLLQIVQFDKSIELIKKYTIKTYSKKGGDVVNKNLLAIDMAKDKLRQVDYNVWTKNGTEFKYCKSNENFVNDIVFPIEKMQGNTLPVSSFMVDGTVPTNTSKYLKRGITSSLPCWNKDNCIQCGNCTLSCPHSAIRAVLVKDENIIKPPANFVMTDAMAMKGYKYKIQISPQDCTGCGVCANTCPAMKKALVMKDSSEIVKQEEENYNYSTKLKKEKSIFNKNTPKGLQFFDPYFEFNYACAGCGETPYIKILTQLFGDRMIVSNATGCSSIYSGSFPVCPYTKDKDGHGPSWANSLFEDNAEFGYGMYLSYETKKIKLKNIIDDYKTDNEEINSILKEWQTKNDISYDEKNTLEKLLKNDNNEKSNKLLENIDTMIDKSIWIIGGDGWAYDIGYGGLDHILASNANVNVLVLDSEVYSNTGGQSSKSTPKSSVAKFTYDGKITKKKDLGAICMTNKNCYVASISLGANFAQAINALNEAKSFNGPSIVICYSPCINHGFDMSKSSEHMKLAVETGYWNLYRFNPAKDKPLTLDSDKPKKDYIEFLTSESRYTSLIKKDENRAKQLFEESKKDAMERRNFLLNQIKLQDNE